MLKDYDYIFSNDLGNPHIYKGKFRQVNHKIFGGHPSHAKDHMPRHKQEYFELSKQHRILSYLHSHQNFWQWFEEWQTNLRKGIHLPPPGLNIRSFPKKSWKNSLCEVDFPIGYPNTKKSWTSNCIMISPSFRVWTKKYLEPRPSHGFQRFKVPVSNAKVLGQVFRLFGLVRNLWFPCEKKGSEEFKDAHPNTKWRAGRQAAKRETHDAGEFDGGFAVSNAGCFQQVLSHVAGSRSCCKKYPGACS